jgi:hypothetical protein
MPLFKLPFFRTQVQNSAHKRQVPQTPIIESIAKETYIDSKGAQRDAITLTAKSGRIPIGEFSTVLDGELRTRMYARAYANLKFGYEQHSDKLKFSIWGENKQEVIESLQEHHLFTDTCEKTCTLGLLSSIGA